PDSNGWYNHALTVTWNGTDATSGIDSCTKTPYGGPDNGGASLPGTCTDVAGNTSSSVAFNFKYDATPPVLTLAFTPDTPDGMNGWWKTPGGVPFAWTCSDATSGIDGTYSGGCPTPLSGTVTTNGTTTFDLQVRDEAGNLSVHVTRTLKLDNVAPTITWNSAGDSCSLPGNAGWCRGTETAAFTASDTTSGLANLAQASFPQSTGTNGTAILIASGSVMDQAGNVASSINAGPYKIDSIAPTISLTAPGNGQVYVLNAAIPANYSCNDATSGVATCSGPVPSGTDFSTTSVGSHSFTVAATDEAGNIATSVTNTYSIQFGTCLLYDPTRSVKSGATYPLKLYLCDANNNDVSSPAIVVHAASIYMVSGFSGAPEDSGNANPDSDFRFDPTLGPSGGYIFNLQTKGLSGGTYGYTFTATGDGQTHPILPGFGVK
ncbi:MAG TPA: hypothetical protein VJR26_12840, partial [Candidatus Acidoferrales bacterium]|nr:hypothetical protein [Candidatus Acidoferrales bacterium]